MKLRIGLTACISAGLLVSSSVGALGQEDESPSSGDTGRVMSPGALGKSLPEWASEWQRLRLAVPLDASVEEQCAAGDQGDVFIVLVGTEDLGTCTIREDQHILRQAGMTGCSVTVDTFGKVNGSDGSWRDDLRNATRKQKRAWARRQREARDAIICQHDWARVFTDVSVTVDGVTTALDEGNQVIGPPFEYEADGSRGDPGRYVSMPAGIVYMLRPLAAGQHRLEIAGVQRSPDNATGDAFDIAVDLDIAPATEGKTLDDGSQGSADSGPLVPPGPLGKSYSEWASEWERVWKTVSPDDSVEDQCAAGDQGEVFVDLVGTERLIDCTIRADQYILRPVQPESCSLPIDTFDRLGSWRYDLTGANRKVKSAWARREREARLLLICQQSQAGRVVDVSVTVDGVKTAIDESFFAIGTPFEYEGDGTEAGPGRHAAMTSGTFYMLEPLAEGPHRIEFEGIEVIGRTGFVREALVEVEIMPATER